MDAKMRTHAVTTALAIGLCVGGAALTPLNVDAQLIDNSQAEQPAEPNLELDIAALLSDERVFEASVESQVWSIQPQPGRRLIQIPVIVTPKNQQTRLSTPSLKLKGGRFIAWRIVRDDQNNTGQASGGGFGSGQSPSESPLSIGALRNIGQVDLNQLDQTAEQPQAASAQQVTEPTGELTEEVPVLARDITVSPRGVMYWQLERAIPGAEVKSGETGYLLKLRPDRLAALEPERPDRANTRQTGGTRPSAAEARQAAEQRRNEELEFREKAQAYRDLRDHVRDLPESFQAALPAHLWAVYEVPERTDELGFTGEPPMPWSIKESDLTALKQVATRSAGGAELTAEDFAAVSQMTLMLADENPLTQRIVAGVLSRASMYGRAQQGDALYRLIDKLLKGGDPEASRTATAGLASTVPPTPATLALLKGAFDQMDPGSKLLALGGLLSTQDNDPAGQRQMIDTANQMIADPQGPGVAYVLEQLVIALANKPEGAALVGGGIKFDSLEGDALDQAIVYVADAAGTSDLAAQWMEHGLLGSANPAVSRRTVEVLATSAPGGGPISRLSKALIELTFGPADPDAQRPARPKLRGIARIPITTTGHSIYRALNAGDPETRSLGWKALKHFQITEGNTPAQPTTGFGEDAAAPDRLSLILDAAFAETVTPPQLVAFLANQQDAGPATAALVRVVVEGRGPAITQAAHALVRSGRQLDQPLQALSPEQRGTFAARLYESVNGSSPMVAGLLRVTDSRTQVVSWFAQQVSTTGLPDPSAWTSAVNSEQDLLTLAASSDPELADAAVAALVASAGGDELTARDLARRMSNATDRTAGALSEQWSKAKQEIYTEKLKHAAGQYRLIINLRGQAGGQPTDPFGGGFEGSEEFPGAQDTNALANTPLISSINVALIDLQADGSSLKLASGTLTLAASDARLAIAIQQPNELKDFGNKELDALPLETIQGKIELLPQKDGSWRGAARLDDGRVIEVVFDPE